MSEIEVWKCNNGKCGKWQSEEVYDVLNICEKHIDIINYYLKLEE